jgi:hypothetical protein
LSLTVSLGRIRIGQSFLKIEIYSKFGIELKLKHDLKPESTRGILILQLVRRLLLVRYVFEIYSSIKEKIDEYPNLETVILRL